MLEPAHAGNKGQVASLEAAMSSRRPWLILACVLALATPMIWQGNAAAGTALQVGANGYYVPDYFGGTPNWANTPPLTKFLDSLPPLGCGVTNNLGQCLPVAVADQNTYLGSDYYEIAVVEYTEQMHSELPPTRLRGYVQIETPATGVGEHYPLPGGRFGLTRPHYLGPIIVAQKLVPVRVKFVNLLPAGAGGKLFIPTDVTLMGAGVGPDADWTETGSPADQQCASAVEEGTPAVCFAENRATLHLHGGRSPWISDGTPHQWITPPGENPAAEYHKGQSVAYVPDMWFDAAGDTITACAKQLTCDPGTYPDATNNPGPGAQTFFWPNHQSSRLMFYHDHAWGITRLNVYAGEAAGYVIQDEMEDALVAGGTIDGRAFSANTVPAVQYPLVLQDKTFVDGNPLSPTYVLTTDPTWAWGSNPEKPATTVPMTGDLWWPHVYMPAQNPYDVSGANAMGRWHYGPWFWPPTNVPYGPVPNPYYDPSCIPNVGNNFTCQPPEMPGTPNPSWGAEAFLDTPVVNGTAYPYLEVPADVVRFRILNASHDRFFNLQFYVAASKNGPTTPGAGVPVFSGFPSELTEVAMVPAVVTPGFPEYWPADHREGGVPDPATRGPAMIQIAAESGFLPAPSLLVNKPVTWNNDVTTFNAGNVNGGTLVLAPAERADVIVDFRNFAGKTLILYNDAPAPFPALDPHYDYYTGAPDLTDIGGVAGVAPGLGPNTRTLMQIRVAGSGGLAPADDYDAAKLAALQTAFATTVDGPGVFKSAQDPIMVGQGTPPATASTELGYDPVAAYNSAYGVEFPSTWPNWGISRIGDNYLGFQLVDENKTPGGILGKVLMLPKAIQDEMGETFDEYGRMSAKLGLEMAFTDAQIQTFIMQNYVDPPTEKFQPGEMQIWKITHNGVDTHPVHFHLFDVQVLNRVGWDGFIRMPDPNELGWKDTVKISPLEDTIVAVRARLPVLPFDIPLSQRYLNPAAPEGSAAGFTGLNPLDGQPVNTINISTVFGHEYVWHCHILSHEEMDMMRTITVNNATDAPTAPTGVVAVPDPLGVSITWTDTANNESGFRIERAPDGGSPFVEVGRSPVADVTKYIDTSAQAGTSYVYRVVAFNTALPPVINEAASDPATAPANSAPNAPANLKQYAANGTTEIPLGGPITGTTAVFKGTVSDPDSAQKLVLQVEVKPMSAGFDGTTSCQSAPANNGATASCTVAGLTPGDYHWRARAVDPVGVTSAWQTYNAVEPHFAMQSPISFTSLTSDVPSPQPQGTTITFTPNVTGGTGSYEYRWGLWMSSTNWVFQPWSQTATTFAWTPTQPVSSAYIGVYVRDVGTNVTGVFRSMAYRITQPAIVVNTLTSDVNSPQQVGTTITFSATATGGTGSYESRWGVWTSATDWIYTAWAPGIPSFPWTPAQAASAHVGVWVRDAGTTAAGATRSVAYSITQAPITVNSLTTDLSSPQVVNTTITFSATATGGTGSYESRWGVWTSATNWVFTAWAPGVSSFPWTPTQAASAYVGVWVRNAGATDAGVGRSVPYSITQAPITVNTLTSDLQSPQVVNTTITFSATASGGSGSYESRWAVWTSATGWVYTAWGAPAALVPDFPWTPTQPANAYVAVQVRNAGSTGTGTTRSVSYNILP
jgi:FtsP/CotA-like multicopper oxidase with cupredoxin domain